MQSVTFLQKDFLSKHTVYTLVPLDKSLACMYNE